MIMLARSFNKIYDHDLPCLPPKNLEHLSLVDPKLFIAHRTDSHYPNPSVPKTWSTLLNGWLTLFLGRVPWIITVLSWKVMTFNPWKLLNFKPRPPPQKKRKIIQFGQKKSNFSVSEIPSRLTNTFLGLGCLLHRCLRRSLSPAMLLPWPPLRPTHQESSPVLPPSRTMGFWSRWLIEWAQPSQKRKRKKWHPN